MSLALDVGELRAFIYKAGQGGGRRRVGVNLGGGISLAKRVFGVRQRLKLGGGGGGISKWAMGEAWVARRVPPTRGNWTACALGACGWERAARARATRAAN